MDIRERKLGLTARQVGELFREWLAKFSFYKKLKDNAVGKILIQGFYLKFGNKPQNLFVLRISELYRGSPRLAHQHYIGRRSRLCRRRGISPREPALAQKYPAEVAGDDYADVGQAGFLDHVQNRGAGSPLRFAVVRISRLESGAKGIGVAIVPCPAVFGLDRIYKRRGLFRR